MTQPPLPDQQGKIVAGRYRVERLLGQGGMGSVWAGRHTTLGHLVAIKFIHPQLATSREALRRFDLEAKAAARLKTRHAVAVYDHGVTVGGEPYIVMEYLDGESLEQRLRRAGPLPLRTVTEIVNQAAKALASAHERGIVHRDLKPDNIFLANDDEAAEPGFCVKLVDFGIAKILEGGLGAAQARTQTGMVVGTPHYMSPEAFTESSPVTPASDVWSLGACAFAAACGRVPFQGDAIGEVVLKVCAAPMPVPSAIKPELPKAFDAWFEQACARAIGERFPSALAAAEALTRLDAWHSERRELTTYELRRRQAASLRPAWHDDRPSRRGLVLGGALAGASVMLGVLGYYVVHRTRAADAAAAAVAASARAVIDAENERRLREAEQQFWRGGAGAGPLSGRKPRTSSEPVTGRGPAPTAHKVERRRAPAASPGGDVAPRPEPSP
jgi:serine/threonine-protein kinase